MVSMAKPWRQEGMWGFVQRVGWVSCQHPKVPLRWELGVGPPHLADVLTHIFNDHLISCDGFHGKQTPLVDPAPAESELLLPELEGRR